MNEDKAINYLIIVFNEQDFIHTMTISQAQAYMTSLFVALAHLHNSGVIHRDIKPGNLLFSLENERSTLVDFGLAHMQSVCFLMCQKWGRNVLVVV